MTTSTEEPLLLSWSGGKDCALALYQLLQDGFSVASLLTTVTEDYDRISMHGVRRSLLLKQAEALQLPLREVEIPPNASNEIYEARMGEAFREIARKGTRQVVFGDVFLEDIRAYRENLVAPYDLEAVFPLWQRDTTELARWFIESGFRARIVCVDTEQLSASFAGRDYDDELLSDLPSEADPCGENGEFHTFVYDGPTFKERIAHQTGEVVLRDDRFAFCDLLPGDVV